MQFLADVFVPCEQCDGKRFRPQVLDVRYKGKNVDQVLDLTVREALTFFAEPQRCCAGFKCSTRSASASPPRPARDDAVRRGSAAIKIASHLGSQSGERVLYVLDEPTTGLHFDDIVKLLAAFRKLLQAGHSLLVIEHNLDVLKTADWIIDSGPEGRRAGGYLVAAGSPEHVASVPASYTGQHLHRILSAAAAAAAADAD
jgi:excinuclease ABC subunit A